MSTAVTPGAKHYRLGRLRLTLARQKNYTRFHWRVGYLFAWTCWRGRLVAIAWLWPPQ